MELFKRFSLLGFIAIVTLNFSECASTLKLEQDTPIQFGKAYYQSWVAGVEDGGSGFNLYIPIISKPNNIVIDSVYFKNKRTVLEQVNPSLYVGRFKRITYVKKDIIMSNEPYAEYGNSVPKLQKNIPFELKEDECVLSYTENNRKKYYRITGLIKKEPMLYPSAPPKKL